MRKLFRILIGGLCVLIVAVAILSALFAAFLVAALVSVWVKEGRLLTEDIHLLTRGAGVMLVSAVTIAGVWWIGRRVLGSEIFGASFQEIPSKRGRTERLAMNVSAVAMFGVFTVWFYERTSGNEWLRFVQVLIWLFAVFLALHLRVLFHELGHLWAALLLGMHPSRIQIGAGRLLWGHSSRGGLRWEWRLWPQIGLVYATQTKLSGFKWRQLGFIVGGPFADACMVWIGYALITRSFGGLIAAFTQSAAGVVVFVLFWLTATSALNGLIPHRIHLGVQKLHTDGYWLFCLIFLSDEKAKQFLARKEMEQFNELAKQVRAYASENPAR
jgi:hypothetical protein